MSAEKEKVQAQRVDLVNIEIDGVALQAPKGSMIITATDRAGIDIPRFCYHPKLSIAANCRMCLVDVEKAPKPMPACATPVMEGMKVFTKSRRAVDAQHGVMEFLLINHPLDCPICDQGGECELQDLAMGYGRSVSRFTERKRVVKDKNVGSLVQTDMTRCIHCTRCVRFLEEIAGTTEMGGTGRGDRMEIGTCVENSIDSELSGNIIDLCPVGALTNKPFRYSARAWELTARPTVAMHDGVGSWLYYHARNGRIMRAVPRDNEATNEVWLSDRDRFSHFGLYAEDRALQPLVKQGGSWQEVTWDQASKHVVGMLRTAGGELRSLISPSATTEEHFLLQRLTRGLGSAHVDHRLRESDFRDDATRTAAEFECRVADIGKVDSVLMVGCNPRHEAPIIGHRLRKAWRAGARIAVVNPLDWEVTFHAAPSLIVPPQQMAAELARVALALAAGAGKALPDPLAALADGTKPAPHHEQIAGQLSSAGRGLVLLGQFGMALQDASALRALARWIARASGSALNLLTHGANSTGAWKAGAIPHLGPGGMRREAGENVKRMLASGARTWLLWDLEPELDIDDPAAVGAALGKAEAVVAVSPFASEALKRVASVILPLAPYPESEGSLITLDGTFMSIAPAGRVQGEARPGWKILRRLGEELGLEGFGQVGLEQLQAEMLAAIQDENPPAQDAGTFDPGPAGSANGLHRIGEVPMYGIDALCRRSQPLQRTVHAENGFVGLNGEDARRLGLTDGGKARVRQNGGFAELKVHVSARVPPGAAWVRVAHESARTLGAATGPVSVEVA